MQRYFTRKGYDLYKRRVEQQKSKVDSSSKSAGEAAGSSYDWHDNFGYEEARRQAEMEARRLEEMVVAINAARVFDPPEQAAAVRIGNTVRFRELSSDIEREVTVGGFAEVDPDLRLVSYESPLAACLLGKSKGDTVDFARPDGDVGIVITEILPPSKRYFEVLEEFSKKLGLEP